MDAQPGTASADELAQMTYALEDSRRALALYVSDTRDGTANLRSLWRSAVDDMLAQLTRWAEGLAGTTPGSGTGTDAGLSGLGDAFGTVGTLVSLLGSSGSPTQVQLSNPTVPRPSAALTSTTRQSTGAQETVAAGAVQITAQTLDDRAVAQAADTLAAEIRRRLTFDDTRAGRL